MPEIKSFAVYGGGSDQTVYAVQTMQQLVSDSMTSQRFPMILLGIFAMLALVLASIGIYGVVSYSISQRVQEIGVRMALGAGKGDILRMVITQGVRLALIGIVIGGMAALVITRFLSNFSRLLSGVGAGDPATFVTVAAALSCVALLACYIPARRAIRIDPMAALATSSWLKKVAAARCAVTRFASCLQLELPIFRERVDTQRALQYRIILRHAEKQVDDVEYADFLGIALDDFDFRSRA